LDHVQKEAAFWPDYFPKLEGTFEIPFDTLKVKVPLSQTSWINGPTDGQTDQQL
jgi:hypothetical protein